MTQMFYNASAFNQNIGSWNASRVGRNWRQFATNSLLRRNYLPSTWQNTDQGDNRR
jgi:Mycoplasma protein of unknown function, DUF285